MISIHMKSSLIVSLFFVLGLTGCSSFYAPKPALDDDLTGPRPEPYGEKVIILNVPPRLSLLQVRQSILNASLEKGWSILESGYVDENGIVKIRNKSLLYESIFTFVFDPTVVEGYSESYVLNHLGNRSKRYTPPPRVSALRKEIVRNLESQIAGY